MKVYKTLTISCAHQLNLPYDSPCNRPHGHNYKIEVWAMGALNEHGMVVDYNKIGQVVKKYDHQNLNELMDPTTPTAENFALRILNDLQEGFDPDTCEFAVRVWESDTCYAYVSGWEKME